MEIEGIKMKTVGELKNLIRQEGDYELGSYKNTLYEVKRTDVIGCWCGCIYIDINKEMSLTDNVNVIAGSQINVNDITFGSITKNHIIYGFACTRWGDITPYALKCLKDEDVVMGIYRTKEYTINRCKSFIDQFMQSLKIQGN